MFRSDSPLKYNYIAVESLDGRVTHSYKYRKKPYINQQHIQKYKFIKKYLQRK